MTCPSLSIRSIALQAVEFPAGVRLEFIHDFLGSHIDTNVISEYNREQLPHPGVVKWLDTTPDASQYVSVLTLAEIEKGILRKEEGKRRRDLQRWFDEDLPARFAGRILAFDARVTGRAGWVMLPSGAIMWP